MNVFQQKLQQISYSALHAEDIRTMQVNVGFRCNQECNHCHVQASPERIEIMEWRTMERILEVADSICCREFDITGGAPELNPDFQRFIIALKERDARVIVRTNLTVLKEPGLEDIPTFFRENRIELVASMPCYRRENVSAQRGEGVYDSSIEVLTRLNDLGYGTDPDLKLDLVYNPGGPFLPPDQFSLERDYRRELHDRFGVRFTRLLTITNMPIGRFLDTLRRNAQERNYITLLRDAFNPGTLDTLMCRHHISIGWDGSLYDCDFNMALGYKVGKGLPDTIMDFNRDLLRNRRIVTGDHCLGCTAGQGSSCSGALVGPDPVSGCPEG